MTPEIIKKALGFALFRDGVERCAKYLINPSENHVFAAPPARAARRKISSPAPLPERKNPEWYSALTFPCTSPRYRLIKDKDFPEGGIK